MEERGGRDFQESENKEWKNGNGIFTSYTESCWGRG